MRFQIPVIHQPTGTLHKNTISEPNWIQKNIFSGRQQGPLFDLSLLFLLVIYTYSNSSWRVYVNCCWTLLALTGWERGAKLVEPLLEGPAELQIGNVFFFHIGGASASVATFNIWMEYVQNYRWFIRGPHVCQFELTIYIWLRNIPCVLFNYPQTSWADGLRARANLPWLVTPRGQSWAFARALYRIRFVSLGPPRLPVSSLKSRSYWTAYRCQLNRSRLYLGRGVI